MRNGPLRWFGAALSVGVASTTLGVVNAAPASAAPTIGLVYTIKNDGTPSFTATAGPGNDTGPNNGVTRTNDTVTFNWGINVNGGASTGGQIVQTLPVGMIWDKSADPIACLTATYTDNDRTITCVLDAQASGSAFDSTAIAIMKGSNANGTVLSMPAPTFTVTSATGPATAAPQPTRTTTVSATPKLNLRKDRYPSQYSVLGPDGVTPGLLAYYPLSIEVIGGGKGGEAFNSGPITITDQFTEFGAGTGLSPVGGGTPLGAQAGKLYTWGAPGTDPGCGYNGQSNPRSYHRYWDLPYGSPNFYGTTFASDPTRNLANAGAWSCTQATPGGPISMTITGADITGNHRATKAGYPYADYPLPADTTIMSAGWIAVWYPITDFPTTGTYAYQLDVRNRATFAGLPTSLSGAPNVEPHNVATANGQDAGPNPGDTWYGTNDNNYIHTLTGHPGDFNKWYTSGETSYADFPMGYYAPGSLGYRAGDIWLAPGQNFGSFVDRPNNGFLDLNTNLCDVFDNTWQEVSPLIATVPGNAAGSQAAFMANGVWTIPTASSGAFPTPYVIEYGTKPEADLNGLRNASCDDGDGPWFTDLGSITGGASAVTRVRAKMLIQPTVQAYLRINMKVKSNAPTNALLTNFGSFKDQYNDQSVNNGWSRYNYTPGNDGTGSALTGKPWNALGYISDATLPLPTGEAGDRARVARAQARVKKKTIDQGTNLADDSVNAVRAGKTVAYELSPTFTSYLPVPPTADHFYVYDTLDKWQTYVPGSSVVSPNSPAVPQPTVMPGTDPVSGNAITTLRWDFGSRAANTVLPTIRYKVRTKSNAPGGTAVENSVMVNAVDAANAPIDESMCLASSTFSPDGITNIGWTLPSQTQVAQNADATCARGWSRNVTVNQVAALTIGKEVVEKAIQPNGTFTFRSTYANVQQTPTLTDIDVIDVLPEVGDNRVPSNNFVGTATLKSTIALIDSVGGGTKTFTFTKAAKSTVRSIHETDPANPLPITTVQWCASTSFGTAGCPADWNEVTAWRLHDNGPLDKGDYGTVEFQMVTKDNQDANVYTNRLSAKAAEVSLPVASEDVSIPVVAGKLSNFVWIDANANGQQDAGEVGLGGASVKLFAANGTTPVQHWATAGADGVRGTADDTYADYAVTTGSNGLYSFDDLPAGDYVVTFTPPAGYLGTVPTTGSTLTDSNPTRVGSTNVYKTPVNHLGCRDASGVDMFPTCDLLLLDSVDKDPTIDAGFWQPASVGDLVWLDTDGNGQQNGAEVGVAGAKVTLWQDADGNPATVDWVQVTQDISGTTFGTAGEITTGSTGAYLFDNLKPGVFQVRFTAPTGMQLTTANLGADATDSDAVIGATPNVGTTGAITLNSGDALRTVDAGVYALASIGNRVWEDLDRNGKQDAGEVGVANIPVQLTGTDGAGNAVTFNTTTIADGSYLFPNLVPGSYTVSVLPALGYMPTVANAGTGASADAIDSDVSTTDSDSGPGQRFSASPTTLVSGQNDMTWDAGLIRNPVVSGHVYVDDNNNGTRASSEPGIGGVILTLTGKDSAGNTVLLTATTDDTGFYSFGAVSPSDSAGYTITETHPTAYLDGKDVAGSTGGTVTNDVIGAIVVRSSDVSIDNDFGELRGASLGGNVYVDNTNDGILQSGEPAIANVTVTLTGTDDLGNQVSLSMPTGADGSYLFSNLRPGTYTVTETQPSAYADGKDTAGNTGGTVGNDVLSAITLGSGQDSRNNNFGELPTSASPLTRLEGSVWLDPNRDGARQLTENTGIAGVTITLKDASGNVVATTTTDANGHYVFDGINPGTYTVEETQPGDYLTTSTNTLGYIVVPAGGKTNQDFFEALGSLSGHVYVDTIDSGTLTAGEPGIGGVTVTLYNATTGAAIASTVTSADGSYTFPNLQPGSYKVVETQPSNWTDDLDTAGSLAGTVTNDQITAIALTAGDNGIDYNFGEQPAPTTPGKTWVSGHVYLDANNDSSLNSGDTGLAGVTVTLKDASGATVATTVTGADGSYLFNNIDPGTYTIVETQPAGYGSTENPANTISSVNVPLAGLPNQNFGETLPAGTTELAFLSGVVWIDRNGDGVIDPSEGGIFGVVMTLKDAAGNVVATTTTGPGGFYQFVNLAPGTYTVEETQPAGYANSAGTPATTRSSVTVPASGLTNQNFGERLALVSGHVFQDTNGTGTLTLSEPGIGGTTIKLTGTDINGNPVTRTVQTDAGGYYEFLDLLPSNAAGYTITETQPAGYADGGDAAGSLGGTSANDVTSAVVVAAGDAGINYNFGEVPFAPPTTPGTVWIGGIVYLDKARDGVIGNGDTPMAGVNVYLKDAAGNTVGTTTTLADGSYFFTGLTPGASYTVVENQPVGYGSSQASTNQIAVTAPATGGTTGFNFGETLSTISGLVWVDTNNDGVRQATEIGIPGVTVTLTGTAADGTTVNTTVVTDPAGRYVFDGLKGGTYTVTETQPLAYIDGKEAYTGTGAAPTTINDQHGSIALPLGADKPGYDFGERNANAATTFVQGRVFHDRGTDGLTHDGVYQAGEPALGGVTIVLKDAAGNVVATTTTLADGTYRFDGLVPGNYTVQESQPNGYGSSTPNVLSISVPATGKTDVDFGETLGTVGGTVFNDRNKDGVLGSGDVGIGGVLITLTGVDANGNQVSRTATTNPDGTWSIVDLPPSGPAGYTMTETQPGQYGSSTSNSVTVTLGAEDKTGINFGETLATVNGTVYGDTNNNGVQDPGEPGIGGVLITLEGFDVLGNRVTLTTVTNADGTWTMIDVPASSADGYNVIESQPLGWNDGKDGSPAGSVGNDRVTKLIVTPGGSVLAATFGEIRPTPAALPRTGTDVRNILLLAGLLVLLGGVLIPLSSRRRRSAR
jgi:protocatechuate 3,4-dioxygenase beta subunit